MTTCLSQTEVVRDSRILPIQQHDVTKWCMLEILQTRSQIVVAATMLQHDVVTPVLPDSFSSPVSHQAANGKQQSYRIDFNTQLLPLCLFSLEILLHNPSSSSLIIPPHHPSSFHLNIPPHHPFPTSHSSCHCHCFPHEKTICYHEPGPGPSSLTSHPHLVLISSAFTSFPPSTKDASPPATVSTWQAASAARNPQDQHADKHFFFFLTSQAHSMTSLTHTHHQASSFAKDPSKPRKL